MEDKGITRLYGGSINAILFTWHLLKDLFHGIKDLKVYISPQKLNSGKVLGILLQRNSRKATNLPGLLKKVKDVVSKLNLKRVKKLGIEVLNIKQYFGKNISILLMDILSIANILLGVEELLSVKNAQMNLSGKHLTYTTRILIEETMY